MFIHGKPILFEYKIWCLCRENGYPYNLNTYTGKSDSKKVIQLGIHVVQDMVDIVKEHSGPIKHKLFFNNFFRSYNLLEILADQNVKAIKR